MAEAVKDRRTAWRRRLVVGLALIAMALPFGCASAKPTGTAALAPTSQTTPAPAATAVAEAPRPVPPVELTSLDAREGAPGVRVEVQAAGSLVWTSYRDASGNLVIELPNSVPGASFAGLEYAQGLLAAVKVETASAGDRPLTRLVVQTRDEAEHSLAAEGGHLSLQLLPVASAPRAVVAAEPLPRAERPAAAGTAVPAGTPEQPYVAPAPAGVAATRLAGIEILPGPDGGVVRVAGDGEFAYSSFRLENPERFVIDLPGVTNTATRGAISVGNGLVERVRISQFKPQPQPISRVVFDLSQRADAVIERSSEGIAVRFAATAGQPTTLAEDLQGGAPANVPAPRPAAPAERVAEAPAPPVSAPAAPAPVESAPPAPAVAAPAEELAATSPPASTIPPAPAASEPTPPVIAAAAPAPTAIAAKPRPAEPSDVALFEAANVQAPTPAMPPAATPGVPAPSSFTPQTVGGGQKRYSGEPISLSLKDADIKDVLRSFAKISGLNMVLQPDVKGTVTVELETVPWDQALDQILRINGLGYELDGNIMRIARIGQLQEEAKQAQEFAQAQALSVPLRTVLKRLSYANSTEVSTILLSSGRGGAIMSQRGSVQVDRRTNTLIIKELPNYIDTVIAVIESLDIPEPQVMIEARIVETTKRFSRSLGIAWGLRGIADAAHGNTTGLIFPNNISGNRPGGMGGGAIDLLTGGSNALLNLTLGNVLDTFKLDIALQAAENEGLISVLSAPKIATLNNGRASIQSGLQIPIQTVANNTVTVQFVNATLRLDVTPQVTAEGTIMMDINVQKREPQLAFAVVGAANAPIATKEAQTRVIVRDGGTTVIGGIFTTSTDQGQDRVPGLANVPILGHLFKNHRRTDENQELLIFITPRVIKL